MKNTAPLAGLAVFAAVTIALPAGVATASSVTYVKDGNVWLSSPDGAAAYQVTTGAGWRSPSQADDGTLVAQHGTRLVRMTRSGQVIGTPVDVGTGAVAANTTSFRFFGPYDPDVSPDGRTVAYWFTAQDVTTTTTGTTFSEYHDFTTTTPVDHFEGGPDRAAYGAQHPSWIGSDRTLVTSLYAASSDNVWTWVPGGAADHEQYWFGQPQQGIVADADLSRDGARIAATALTDGLTSTPDKLWVWTTNGASWTGAPPYDNLAEGAPRAPKPTLRCQLTDDSAIVDPTWSPDGRRLVYQDDSGVRILQVPDDLTGCTGFDDALLMAGAQDPDWGPADVDLRQRPAIDAGTPGTGSAPGAGGTAGTPGTGMPGGVTPGTGTTGPGTAPGAGGPAHLRLLPSTVRRGRRVLTTRFRMGAAGDATVTVSRCPAPTRCAAPLRRQTLHPRTGTNTARVGPVQLAPGRYRVSLSAAGTTLSASLRVTR